MLETLSREDVFHNVLPTVYAIMTHHPLKKKKKITKLTQYQFSKLHENSLPNS